MKNFFKRTASAILTLAIVISACSGIVSTFAASGDGSFSYELVADNNTTQNVPTATSAVKSTSFTFKEWNGSPKEKTYADSVVSKLTDSTAADVEFSGTSFATNWGGTFRTFRDGTTSYLDIVHTLDGVCDVSDVLVINRAASSNYWWISYKIYAGNQKETLFDNEPVLEYDNTGAKTRTQRFKTKNLKAKYVAMRITAATSNADTSVKYNESLGMSLYYVRMQEFNVYGTKDANFGKPSEDAELAFPAAPARPVVKNATANYTNGTDSTPATINFSELLYNGSVANGSGTIALSNSPYKNDSKNYTDVVLELKGQQVVNDIYIAHDANSDYIPREYELYIGKSKETLFSGDPYYTYKSDSPKAVQHYEITGFVGSYVGLRYIKPHKETVTGADSQIRLREFNVYTDEPIVALELQSSSDEITGLPTGTSVVESAEVFYKSALAAQRIPSEYSFDGGDTSEKTALEELTDGVIDKKLKAGGTFAEGTTTTTEKIHVNDGEAYTDIVYTLDGVCNIEKIIVAGVAEDKWSLSYKIYAGNDKDTLFNSDPIYTFDNTSKKHRTQVYSSEQLAVKYVALRITAMTPTSNVTDYASVNSHWMYARISQFAVFGTVDMGVRAPASGNSVAMPTGDSLVKSATAYYYDGSERKETTLNDGAKLYDCSLEGTATTSAEAPMNVSGNYTDIVLTLEGEGIITDIYVANADNSDYFAREYEIYISSDKDKLFKKPYYIYKTSMPSRVQSYAIDTKIAKYVGIRVKSAHAESVSESFVRLSEFNVFGSIEKFAPDKGDAGATIPSGNNFLKGVMATTKFVNTNDSSKDHTGVGDVTGITDGNTSVQHMGAGARGFARLEGDTPIVTRDGSIYAEYTFVLDGTATVEKFYFCGGNSTATQTGKFEIYVSDKASTLYDNALIKVDNTSTFYRAHLIELNVPIENIRYIGLRITDPINTDNYTSGTMAVTKENETTHNIYPRINEFAAFGEFKEDVWEFKKVTEVGSYNIPKGIDLSGLSNLTHPSTTIEPSIKAYQKEGDKTAKITSSVVESDKSSIKFLSDGDPKTRVDINRPVYAVPDESGAVTDYTENKTRYTDIYYDLRSVADISYIVLAFSDNPGLVTGNYAVYLGDTKGSLFEGEPYVTVDNATQYRTTGANDKMNIIGFDKTDSVTETARFVGIRMYNPISEKLGDSPTTTVKYNAYNAVHNRLGEFTVYGKYLDESYDPTTYKPDFIPTKTLGKDLAKIETIYGQNILKPDNLYMYSDGQGDSVTEIAKLRNAVAQEVISRTGEDFLLPQGNFPASGYTKPGKVLDMVFRLDEGDLTEVYGFIFQSTYNESEYMCSDYEVYISEEREDLFSGEPVFKYNEDKYDITNGQIVEFPEDKRVKGCWFAIRIYNTVYTATIENNLYLRASVVFAWGKGAKVKSYPSNIAENMPLDASLVSGSKRTAVSDKNLTIKEQKQLTDCKVTVAENGAKTYTSLTNTYGEIETGGKDLELVYNLCGDIDVSKIAVNTLIDSKHGFKTLKVYASDIIGGVFDEDNLLFKSSVGSKKGNVTLSKTFKKAKQMRYVRFVFEDTKDSVRIYTIDVIGPDTQKMTTRTISSNAASSDYVIYKNDIIAGTSDEFSIYYSLLNDLTDGVDKTYFAITEGLIGQHTYDMIMYLGDLRTVSNIQLTYLKSYPETWPAKINLYVGETKDEVMNKTKPDLVANKKDVKNGILSLDIKPRLARYIRFEFVKFNKVGYYVDPATKKPIITATLADLRVTGTRVTGIQTAEKNETLLTFKDKKSGISLSLKRLDINDIYTNAVGIRVTPEKATNWQMKSLSNNPYFEILDKKVYKIELLDINGNVVTDVGGREITLSVKVPQEYQGGAMFGNASKRTTVTLIESSEEKGTLTAKYTLDSKGDNKVAVLGMISEFDPYWSTIGELEDFEEGSASDLMGEHDPSWYNSIHTTDSRFTVTPLMMQIEAGTTFTATDVSSIIPDSEYRDVLLNAPEKQVAVFYNMELTQNGAPVMDGNAYEIAMTLPASIANNYTDYEVYLSDGMGTTTQLYVEEWAGVLTFQTLSLGNIAIIGTAGEGAFNAVGEGVTAAPGAPVSTGESRRNAAAVIMLLTAAAFVVVLTAKRTAKTK